jgi:uncharacterized protein YdeI (YjbR/CyaY-like superfamily)
MRPRFFATPAAWRKWLEKNHATAREVHVGFYKKASGKTGITYSDAVDQALCFGWIDGKMNSLDDVSYMIRFTPRKPRSNWSAINVKKVEELTRKGLMRPAGIAAFEKRSEDKTAIYSYEQRRSARLDEALEAAFRAHKRAWNWFQDQAPSYKSTAIYWVMSAKREETRKRRLEQLIDDSSNKRRVGPLRRPPGASK